MKKYIILLFAIMLQVGAYAQVHTASVIQNENYFYSSTEYLNKIPDKFINSNILIDRVLKFRSL